MTETTKDTTYYGLTLAQFRERLKKIAAEKGLQGDTMERVVARALEMIPTIRIDDAPQR